jgi:DNA sulfur modification protein DndD
MLRLKKLILEDFGPYKGQQTIDFPDGNGVIVVYGENMRGKTTLLNAIRYALFGTVLTRHAQTLSLTNIENWEKAQEGKHGFKVILGFSYSDASYELTRECKLRRGVTTPQSDSDYEQIYFLQRNGEALGPETAESELNRIMPESVSRFFLFDGELLQQYEELLRDESDMGRKIKESIERILGVPILTQARSNLKRLLDEAQKSESKAAQKNQQTQELGNHHARLIEERTGHDSEIKRLTQDLANTKTKKHALEDEVKKTERLMALFTERERINKEIEDVNKRQAEKESRLREVLASAWKGMLNKKIRSAISEIQGEVDTLRQEDATKNFASYLIEHIEKGIKSDACPTCESPLNDSSV